MKAMPNVSMENSNKIIQKKKKPIAKGFFKIIKTIRFYWLKTIHVYVRLSIRS
jgi:hypothetical protein